MGSLPEVQFMRPILDVPADLQRSLLHERTVRDNMVPGLRLNTVHHRQRIPSSEQINFRVKLLRALRKKWKSEDTEASFLKVIDMVESDGCALFGGLLDPAVFAKLVAAYDKVQSRAGNKAFMHSYANLAVEHEFFLGGDYIEAFSHPLLVALISFQLGGAVRMVDFRGKDNDPMAINAQDNMLHVDNTPFKEEYKVLLNWRRSQVKGPSGQNFTFLPWTHKGNRALLTDDEGRPWSTERDSLFVTDEAIDGLFDFQKQVNGIPRVVEARHPAQPLAILFPAGALVHHRYRTEDGDPRSCIIVAFHLASKHPGQISELPPISGRKRTLIEFLVGYQDENSTDEFLDLLSEESSRIEDKLQELFQPSHPSKLVDIGPLALEGESLVKWRDAVKAAPSPLWHRYSKNLLLSGTDFGDLATLMDRLAAVMDYDKHCNLQMILHEDGQEEIRKPARKLMGEMRKDAIKTLLKPWVSELRTGVFSAHDLVTPTILRVMCDAMAAVAKQLAQEVNVAVKGGCAKPVAVVGQKKIFISLSRLMTDLGEAITRCEGVEAFVVTSLFMFLASEEIFSHLREVDQVAVRSMLVLFLRNYVAAVLLVEADIFPQDE